MGVVEVAAAVGEQMLVAASEWPVTALPRVDEMPWPTTMMPKRPGECATCRLRADAARCALWAAHVLQIAKSKSTVRVRVQVAVAEKMKLTYSNACLSSRRR
jgi:hypothetical protein